VRAWTLAIVEAMFTGALAPNSSSPPNPPLAAGTIAPTFATFTETTIVSLASWGSVHDDTAFNAQARLVAVVVALSVVTGEAVEVDVDVDVDVVVPAMACDGATTKSADNANEIAPKSLAYRPTCR
jgi:hypothetical protein